MPDTSHIGTVTTLVDKQDAERIAQSIRGGKHLPRAAGQTVTREQWRAIAAEIDHVDQDVVPRASL